MNKKEKLRKKLEQVKKENNEKLEIRKLKKDLFGERKKNLLLKIGINKNKQEE